MPLYGQSRDSRPLLPAEHRLLHGALSRLEPSAVKVAWSVLRGRGGGNVTLLPDPGTPIVAGAGATGAFPKFR